MTIDRPRAWLLRLVVAAMLLVIGFDHLHLYLGMYQHIPTIGPLFLANLGLGVVLALLILARPLALFVLGAIAFALGTAAFYAYSLQTPLFQFMETSISYSGDIALAAEGATLLAGLALLLRRRGKVVSERPGRPDRRPAGGQRRPRDPDPDRWVKV